MTHNAGSGSPVVVRNLTSQITHLADVDRARTTGATHFGKAYVKPDRATHALCGVHISEGVVMREGSNVRCNTCAHLARAFSDLTDDGMANTCSHSAASGIDTTPLSDPSKVWRCDHCGMRWIQAADGTSVNPPVVGDE